MQDKGTSGLNIKDISFIKNIKTMAVIGTTKKRNYLFLRSHAENFKGKLYAVNPAIKEIENFPKEQIFSSISEIPGNLDFVFIEVPAPQVLNVMDECVKKGVKLASIFTAEFSDSGTEEGINLEKELIKRAQNKVRILGPNGMGLYYPKLGIAWRSKFPSTSGNIGFVAQSGGMCNIAVYTGKEMGLRFSKVFSFGNGADLDLIDLLDFLNNDPETDIVLSYIEGIKKYRANDLKKVLGQFKKPLVVLKGGKTKRGSIAAKSHTASISGNNRIWDALFKQFNLIEVDSLEQLLNAARIIDFYGIKEVKNCVVFSISGGYGVVLVDLLEKVGMNVPDFTPEIQKEIDKKFFIRGTSSKNPLDLAAQLAYSESIKEIIDVALSDPNIDALIMDFPSWYFSHDFFITPDAKYQSNIIEALCMGHKHNKYLLPIVQRAHSPEDATRISRILAEKKVPVFNDPLEFLPILPKISNFKSKIENQKRF